MKPKFLSIFFVFVATFSFAQFGGGTGTEADPYLLETTEHWDELRAHTRSGDYYEDTHFRMTSDVVWSVPPNGQQRHVLGGFDGSLHGGGHTLTLTDIGDSTYSLIMWSTYIDSLTLAGSCQHEFHFANVNFGTIYRCTHDMTITGNPVSISGFDDDGGTICYRNNGDIIGCVNKSDIVFVDFTFTGGICGYNDRHFFGLWPKRPTLIDSCINYGNLYFRTTGNATDRQRYCAGICGTSYGQITNCINYGDIITFGDSVADVAGIVGNAGGSSDSARDVKNCRNFGRIGSKTMLRSGGICAKAANETNFINCANYGDVGYESNFGGKTAGIVADFQHGDRNSLNVKNCFNAGQIYGLGGGIVGNVGDTAAVMHVQNCFNIGQVVGFGICDTVFNQAGLPDSCLYDKQRVPYVEAVSAGDFSGSAEGRLTRDLVGDTPELRAMLGDGWSYADGRYPIPHGHENDSTALVTAIPIYLKSVNDSIYEHVDSVADHFYVSTVGDVRWEPQNGRVALTDGHAILQSCGLEALTAELGDHRWTTKLNIVSVPTYYIYAVAGEHGHIFPCDSVPLHYGESQTFRVSADPGYRVTRAFVDTVNDVTAVLVNCGGRYTFTDVVADHTIEVTFEAIPTGIDDIVGSDVLFYPNPAASTLTIVGDTFVLAVVTDVAGRVLLTSRESTFYVGDLPSGVYFVEVHDAGGGVRTGRFVRR